MQRTAYRTQITRAFEVFPVVALLGPRQCGKTTLARDYLAQNAPSFLKQNYFDLEDITDLSRLTESKLALKNLTGLIVIDEVQRIPELFQMLRVLVDEPGANRQFLILGSASIELIRQSSETLAGRIGYIELTPFSYGETHELEKLWMRGGFPLSYLANNEENSILWREAYIQTFLERDIPSLGINIPPLQLRRFWMMLAHYHGSLLNASEIGRSLGVTNKTIRHYIDILTGTFMIRELQPWFENISKRQIKSPKIYFRDSGIYHSLLGLDKSGLLTHPKLGASWEGLALEEIIRFHRAKVGESYFWQTQGEAELDLLLLKNGKRLGFEFKYTAAPKITKSMRIAFDDLGLDELILITPGDHDFMLSENIRACNLETYLKS